MEIQISNPFFFFNTVKEWGKLYQNMQLQDLGYYLILVTTSLTLK